MTLNTWNIRNECHLNIINEEKIEICKEGMSSKLFLILFLPHKLDKQNLWIFAFPPKVFQILRSIAKAKQTIKVNAFSTQVICLHHILLCDVFNTTTILEYFLHFHYLKQARYYSDLHQFENFPLIIRVALLGYNPVGRSILYNTFYYVGLS